jgi:hypothetical protein
VLVLVVVRVRETAQPVRRAADKKGMLDYERLDVYQCALQFAVLAFQILENMPRGHGQLSDQLRRATISIPLNIAEGAGKTTERERARYHALPEALPWNAPPSLTSSACKL